MPKKPTTRSSGKKLVAEAVPQAETKKYRATSFASVYVNNAVISGGSFELGITFSEISVDPTSAALSVEEKFRVVMNPAHAKVLAETLAINVARWESAFGRISLPADIVRQLTETKDAAGL